MATERLLPQNLEAECGVLGSLLIDPQAIVLVADFLSCEDFYRNAHRTLYEIIMQLYQRRTSADYITVCDLLEQCNQLEDVGGASYVTSLINCVPTSGNIEHYGRIVSRTALLRRLIAVGGQIVAEAYEDDEPNAALTLEHAEQMIFEIGQAYNNSTATFSHVRDLLAAYVEQLDQVHAQRGTVVRVSTGFADLDRLLGGLQRSDLLVLAGRPGTGKSSLALSIAHNAAKLHRRKVGIFSLEMSKEQIIQRLLAMDSSIDQQRLRTGWVEDDEWERIMASMAAIAKTDIWIDDTSSISTIQLRSRARRWILEYGIDLIIIDYLQLMQGPTSKGQRFENWTQEVGAISRSLKGLARELDIPVLALAQLSRAVESRASKIPQLSDLRESGCLTGDTLVYLPDKGIYQSIREISKNLCFMVLALNTKTWRLEPCLVERAFATGYKATYRLTTRLGRTIKCTANHKFLTVRGWKRLDQLSRGEHLALPRYLQGPSSSSFFMTDAQLGLLGHLIGDGSTIARQPIRYTTNDLELAKTVMHLALEVFGDAINPRIDKDKRDHPEKPRYTVHLTATEHLTHRRRNPVAVWLDTLGIFNLRSSEKFVPKEVFMQSEAGIACFLKHLWSTDGCIHLSHGKKRSVNISYPSSSHQLARQVQSLLLRLGINAKLRRSPQEQQGRGQHQVWVSGKSDVRTFLTLVGSLGANKAKHHALIMDVLEAHVANTNKDSIPHTVWRDLAVPAMRANGITNRQMQIASGMSYCGTGLYKQNISRERAMRLAEAVLSEEIAQLAQSDVYWDEIADIVDDEETDVYDLTIKGLHNFVANDIIVHNSIEADADVVMFIYRDDVYNPASERPNTADIIIAKHRNGPVGEVTLAFDKSQTRFRNIFVSPGEDMVFEEEFRTNGERYEI